MTLTQCVLCSEGFLSAYPWRYAFDATIGAREDRGRRWFAKYYDSALAIPSPEFDQLCNLSQEWKVHLSVGIIERDGATLYCTSILLDRDGKLLYKHRKV